MKTFRIEQAVVYVLATSGCGMTADVIAKRINDERLYVRQDGKPVSQQQIYAITYKYNQIFARDGGLIRLLM